MKGDYQSTIMDMTFGLDKFIIPFMELDWRTRFVYLMWLCFAFGLTGIALSVGINKWGKQRL